MTCLVTLISVVAFAGCGSTARNAAPAARVVTAAFKGSPPALSALHAQADQLLSGGPRAFEARLTALRGYPIVVNKWASWCGPCQSEFPAFQREAVALGREVAFVGVNGKDEPGPAAAFLHRFPVTYPSYEDHNEAIAGMIQASTYYPLTVYIDRKGTIVFVHAGVYTSAAKLKNDIRFYLHVA